MATGRIGTTPVLTTRWSKAPAAGTTSLSGLDDNSVSLVYSVGYEQVYLNGALLSRTNDYTATNGTSITLTNATVAGDIVEVFANATIALTDTYTQSQANGKFINNTLTTTTGDIIYASAANTPARLGIGSTDQVLKVSGGIPAWGTVTATTYPTFSAYSNTDQSQTANTWTKKNFEVEEWDTANNFASSRFTPTTAGYYQVSAGLYANDTGTLGLAFYKNGSEWKGQAWAGSGSNYRCQLTAIVYLNGSTDYVEVYSRSSSGNLYNGAGSVWFQGVGIRG